MKAKLYDILVTGEHAMLHVFPLYEAEEVYVPEAKLSFNLIKDRSMNVFHSGPERYHKYEQYCRHVKDFEIADSLVEILEEYLALKEQVIHETEQFFKKD